VAKLIACPYRTVELGRLFCGLATHEGERSTSRTFNETCDVCQVARIRRAHPCRNLDIGLDLRAHRERTSIDSVLLACKAYTIDLPEGLPDCNPNCPEWSEDPTVADLPEPAEPSKPPEPEQPSPSSAKDVQG
jgi:hypothetical protein